MRWRTREVCMSLRQVVAHASSTSACIDGQWVPARPVSGPWVWRVFAAWWVLMGRADAFYWPGDQ